MSKTPITNLMRLFPENIMKAKTPTSFNQYQMKLLAIWDAEVFTAKLMALTRQSRLVNIQWFQKTHIISACWIATLGSNWFNWSFAIRFGQQRKSRKSTQRTEIPDQLIRLQPIVENKSIIKFYSNNRIYLQK